MVKNSSWSSYNYLYSSLQFSQLDFHAGSTIDWSDFCLPVSLKRVDLLAYLKGKLSGRSQDESLDAFILFVHCLQDWKGEGCCLTCTCLGLAYDFRSLLQEKRYAQCLYFARLFKAFFLYCLQGLFTKPKVFKCNNLLFFFTHIFSFALGSLADTFHLV